MANIKYWDTLEEALMVKFTKYVMKKQMKCK